MCMRPFLSSSPHRAVLLGNRETTSFSSYVTATLKHTEALVSRQSRTQRPRWLVDTIPSLNLSTRPKVWTWRRVKKTVGVISTERLNWGRVEENLFLLLRWNFFWGFHTERQKFIFVKKISPATKLLSIFSFGHWQHKKIWLQGELQAKLAGQT